jgi:hypothetical protein
MSKAQLIQELNTARAELWATVAALDDTREIYPNWTKREFLAHIAGWEAMVFEVIQRHLAHQPQKDYHYTNVDDANERFVSVRKATTIDDARLECEINRFAILTLLDQIADVNAGIPFPWGTETLTEFIHGAVNHERNHMNDILNLDQAASQDAAAASMLDALN